MHGKGSRCQGCKIAKFLGGVACFCFSYPYKQHILVNQMELVTPVAENNGQGKVEIDQVITTHIVQNILLERNPQKIPGEQN